MVRKFVCALVALLLVVGGAFAAEGTVVSLKQGTLTVKVGDKNQEIALRGVKVVDKDGKAIEAKDRATALKEGAKVEVTEKDGKVTEVKVK